MAQQGFSVALFLATIVVALLSHKSMAVTYTVGDTQGWVIPASEGTYATWAANKNFKVGDILVFTFTTGSHDVTRVSKADYDSCSTANPLFTISSGPARISLNSTGEKHYICGVVGHCSMGQKLSITVGAATASPTPSPPASPAPTPTSTITPPPAATAPTPTSTIAPSPVATAPTPTSTIAPSPAATAPTPGSPSPAVSTPTSSPPSPSPGSSPSPQSSTPATPPSPTNSATTLGLSSATLLILAAAVSLF